MLSIPSIRQTTDYTCGAAALLSVLRYYGLYSGGELDLAKELNTNKEWGTDPADIIKIAKKYCLRTTEHRHMTIKELLSVASEGIPVIVAYQAWSDSDLDWSECWEDGHYSVVIGCDDNNIYFEDPSLEVGEVGYISKDEFLDRWHDIGSDYEPLYQYGISLEGFSYSHNDSVSHSLVKIE